MKVSIRKCSSCSAFLNCNNNVFSKHVFRHILLEYCIKKNLENTGLLEKAQVLSMDVMQALRYLSGKEEPFDIIFLDPPYGAGFEDTVLPYLFSSALVHEGTLVILETSLQENDQREKKDYFRFLERCKTYKTNCHLFFRAGSSLEMGVEGKEASVSDGSREDL